MTSSLPEDTHLAYIVSHEAWYAKGAGIGDRREINISASAEGSGGGVAWEFSVEEVDLGQSRPVPALRVKVFDDAFAAFAQIPEFFATLAAQAPASLRDVTALLDYMGAVDETKRTSPYADRSPAASALDTVTAVIRHHPAGVRSENEARDLAGAVLRELRDWAGEQNPES